jgi:LmbE family N-acetylglucosaminyl deacetylase
MNVLAIGAHPDDVEINCAGTLAKFAKQGHQVFIATATSGNIGSATHSMEEIAKVRKAEAASSAACIGAEYICLDYDDEMFFESREVRLRFIDLVRYCKAEVILTHYANDYNPDHELTSKIIRDIAVMIPIAHLKTPSPPFDCIPKIFYFESALGLGFVPSEYVDISDCIDSKKAMLACHESQVAWMKANYKDDPWAGDLVERMLLNARYRGIQCGVPYAEGFIPANDAYRVSTTRILP